MLTPLSLWAVIAAARWRGRLRAAEVARLEGLGARRVDVGQGDGRSFVVMADVEGNEFCVLSQW